MTLKICDEKEKNDIFCYICAICASAINVLSPKTSFWFLRNIGGMFWFVFFMKEGHEKRKHAQLKQLIFFLFFYSKLKLKPFSFDSPLLQKLLFGALYF